MQKINSIDEMREVIAKESFVLFYLSRENCGACTAIKPKVIKLCENYPELKTYYVGLDQNEIISGQYSIFTIPAVLVFAEGKEAVREARNFSILEIEKKLDRLSELMG